MKIPKTWLGGLIAALFMVPLFANIPVPDAANSNLPGTYGNKAVRDNFNNLHVVYTTNTGKLRYQMRPRNGSFSPNAKKFNINFPVNPAVDVDSRIHVGIVCIQATGANSHSGELYYYFKPNNSNNWVVKCIAIQASQPSIALHRGTAYVAYIHNRAVKFLKFPAHLPPDHNTANPETVIETTCNNTGFSKPSIDVTQYDCEPITPVIGYQYYSDEYSQIGFQCPYIDTRVGPQVSMYDANNGWSVVWDDIRYKPFVTSNLRVDMTSLSLSACYRSGLIYLGYSDVLDGDGRTKIAIGNINTWNTHTIEANHASNIDMMANRYYNGGEFRIAWENQTQTLYQTGQWEANQGAPWYMSNIQSLGANAGAANWRAPQAVFDKYCQNGISNTHAFFELEFLGSQSVSHDNYQDSACNNVNWTVYSPCSVEKVYMKNYQEIGIELSLDSFGRIIDEPDRPDGKSVTVLSGHDQFVIRWEEGELGKHWVHGFTLIGGDQIFIEGPAHRELPEIVRLR